MHYFKYVNMWDQKTNLNYIPKHTWKNFRIAWRLFEMRFQCCDGGGNKKDIRMSQLVWNFLGVFVLVSNTFPQYLLYLAFVFVYCSTMNHKTVENVIKKNVEVKKASEKALFQWNKVKIVSMKQFFTLLSTVKKLHVCWRINY